MRFYFLLLIAVAVVSCGGSSNNSVTNKNSSNANVQQSAIPTYGYEVVKAYPHDPLAFTQGLVFQDGFVYESTGELGESSLRKVELESGKVLKKYDLPSEVFGEGLAVLNNEVYQLSWRNKMGWVYDLTDFKLLREFRYSGEGWGLTHDGTHLFMSDGTHVIRVLDPKNMSQVRTIVVNDERGRPLMKLNELEWVKGEIWANVWHSEDIGKPNHIARIDPATGKLVGWLNLANISPDDQNGPGKEENTLNGIAYDPASDRLFVTGKNWKKLYEIKVVQK